MNKVFSRISGWTLLYGMQEKPPTGTSGGKFCRLKYEGGAENGMDKAFINKTSKTEQIQESKNMVMQTLEVNSKKIITESSAVRHLGDFRIRHRYFHWIKVILSVRD